MTAICLEEMRKATKPLERTVHLHTDYEAGIAYIRSRNASSIGTTLPGLFGKPKWVEPELEGDVSAAPFGDGCKKGIRGAKDR